MPGIERVGVVTARRHRSTPDHGDPAQARCVVLVTRVFGGPDLPRAQDLVETLFASSTGAVPADGLISAHFYITPDGTRVFTTRCGPRRTLTRVPSPVGPPN